VMKKISMFWLCVMMAVLIWLPNNCLQAQSYQVYFGDLHEHSIYSYDVEPGSGALPPEKAFAYAKHVALLDFMAITDHTTHLPEAEYQLVCTATRLYDNPDSHFVAIAGQELGSLANSGYGHMNIFEPPSRADNPSDNGTRYDLMQAYQYLIDNNLLGQFNHPTTENGNDNFNQLAYYPPVDSQIIALEVLNGRLSADYERYYLLALANGWHLGAIADQDNHRGNYGNTVSNSGDIYLTGILADSLTKMKIFDALKHHRTYAFKTSPASDRMYLTEFTADGHWMGEEFTNGDSVVDFRIAAHSESKFIAAQLYKNGILIKRFSPDANDFNWSVSDSASSGSVYYFIKLIQEDADILWSSPIWVNSPGEYQSPAKTFVPIQELRQNAPGGVARSLGWTNVRIKGIATVGSQFGADGPGYLQDVTGGIAVYGAAFVEKVIPGYALEIEVSGVVNFFYGQLELIPYTVNRTGVKTFPETVAVTSGEIARNGEAYEGLLVKVEDVQLSGSYPPSGENGNLIMNDGSGACTLRIDKETDIAGCATPNSRVNIVGVVGQYDYDLPFDSGYQLLPRSLNDIQIQSAVPTTENEDLPGSFELVQNYPNPFNASTEIVLTVLHNAQIQLVIYNLAGRLVRTLYQGEMLAGNHRLLWDGKDEHGFNLSSGIYYCQILHEGITSNRKMLLLR